MALIGLGVSIAIGAGVPPYGFKKLSAFLAAYKKATQEGLKPTPDQSLANSCYIAYLIGAWLIAIGVAAIFLAIVFSGN